MEYKDLKRLFHISSVLADEVYAEHFESKDALKIDIEVAGHAAFVYMDSEVYRLLLQAERMDKEIRALEAVLPGKALGQYLINCLIDEVVLTNEIEGVRSSRQEIGEVLDHLENSDKRGRFQGIVGKYLALGKPEKLSLTGCSDIRAIYDDLVLDEVVSQKEKNRPDGTLFRKGSVSVYDPAGREIHRGVVPEKKIMEALEAALGVLTDDELEKPVQGAVFHFLFGYIHPFYDGNGRTGRFISSYLLAQEYSPLVGLRLSYAIKEDIDSYYKAFAVCEHPLNRGDLTPFVILFLEIVVRAMESLRDSLKEKKLALADAEGLIAAIPGINDGKAAVIASLFDVASLLIQATLFAENGIELTELKEVVKSSMPTIYSRLEFFEERGLLAKRKVGRRVYYGMDLQRLTEVAGSGADAAASTR